jgi:tRNA threonylcarbamoyladenosine biosynthesis protein TsaE
MATFISHSPDETQSLGESWGREAQSGWVICLTGDLGSGKTQLVKGLARGLGIQARIQSPTFALVNSHVEGRLPLYHLDLYRLDTPEQVAGAGLDEYLSPDGVAVIEWAERTGINPDAAPNGFTKLRWVRFETLADESRRITYEDIGH